LWQQLRLPGMIRRARPDLFHGALYTLPPRLRVPSVLTVADVTTVLLPELHTAYNRYVTARLLRASCARATRILALSESTKSDLVRLGFAPAARIRVAPGAAGEAFRPVRNEAERAEIRASYADGKRYVLSVGTVEPRKNLPRLLAAYAAARRILGASAPELLVAGPTGWKSRDVERTLRSAFPPAGVRYLGRVLDSDLARLYRGADLFAYVSLYEGFGLSVVEALKSGIPVLTSDRSSLPEASGGAARLVDPTSVPAISDALVALAGSGAERKRLARLSVRAAARTSWERSAQVTLDTYREALEEGDHRHHRD
jgi:glycosyltransferase involved in cell wall biosynthesis